MKPFFIAFATLAVFFVCVFEVRAGVYEDCSPCDKVFCEPSCGKASPWFVRGHAEAGLFVNEYGRKNEYGTREHGPDYNSGNTVLLKNVHNADLQLNQLYVSFGRRLDTRKGFDYGGQVDFMYGTDARYVQSEGLEYANGHGRWADGDYYTALAQLYAEVGYKTVSVKVGKFFIPTWINSILSSDRFFYSLSDSFEVVPVTGSGAMATWTPNKQWLIYGGWVQASRFFDTSHDNAFIGGAHYQMTEKTAIEYSVLVRRRTDSGWNMNAFLQTFRVLHQFDRHWNYLFEWTVHNITMKDAGNRSHPTGYGINNELQYRINSRWAIGARAEWMYMDFLAGFGGDDKYSFSLGANWTPCDWIVFRPELRYDKYENYQYFKNHTEKDQLSGGFSTVFKF